MKIDAKPVWISSERCTLGENPLWDDRTGRLYWIDVMDPAVYRYTPGDLHASRVALPKPPGSLYLATQDRLLVALRNGLAWLDMRTGALEATAMRPPSAEERFNDGRCDAHGLLWISTMDRSLKQGIGSLLRVGPAFATDVTSTGAVLGNGVCFSPDGRFLYFADTFARCIHRHPLGPDGLGPRSLLASLDGHPGRPDGCSVDADGCLWSARAGGARIDRYAPDGRLVDHLEVPTGHPTHCAFGGPGLRTLFVTTSRHAASAASAPDDLAGRVVAFEPGVAGLSEGRFTSSKTH